MKVEESPVLADSKLILNVLHASSPFA